MNRFSHKVTTLSLAVLAQAPPEGIIGAVAGSMIPDIDIRLGITHRTWTHWWPIYLGPLVLVSFVFGGEDPLTIPGVALTYWQWFFLGSLLHIVEDSITVTGVPLFLPVSTTGSFSRVGSPVPSFSRRFSFLWTTNDGPLMPVLVWGSFFGAIVSVYLSPSYREFLRGWFHWILPATFEWVRNLV